MLEQWLRTPYQHILIDPVIRLIDHKISPIQMTMMAAMLGVLFIPALLTGHVWLAVALLLLSGYCDSLDGSLARHQQKAGPLGSVLDITMDRVVEFSVILSFYLLNPIQHALGAILMLGSILLCMTSFLVVGIFSTHRYENRYGKSFYYSAGIIERAEAFAFFIAMALWPQYFSLLAYFFSGLVCLTAIVRLTQFANKISAQTCG